jgi:tRNA nucleotidyltransferase/poly(A) polymerase
MAEASDRRLAVEARDGAELTLPALGDPAGVVLDRLRQAGHEASVVGGSLRDVLLGHAPEDWDIATSATPEAVVRLFAHTTWLNRFGTVTVHGRDGRAQVTTYRAEGGYSDRRRPDEVRFGVSLADDLARRDFTINAIAWVPTDLAARRGRVVDPHGGLGDLRAGVLRAVGDPDERLGEDALRLLRAVRFAHRLRLTLDAATEAAIRRRSELAAGVSGERTRDELMRILTADADAAANAGQPSAPPPSEAFRLMEHLGLLGVILPELAALRGVPQAKAIPGDALDHTLLAVDAADPSPAELRLAALLHDLGKAETLADGHFFGHEVVGADLAGRVMDRLRFPRATRDAVVHAVRHHMFAYTPDWTDAAVRRFVKRVGGDRLPLLLALRRADNAASGALEPATGGIDELVARIGAAGTEPTEIRHLALDGDDLQRALGLAPGPVIGRLLDELMEAVLDDPSLNERDRLLALARTRLGRR